MNWNKAVLGSNFLIFLSKGLIDLELLRAAYERLFVSIITYMEVYGYNFIDENEKARLDDVFTHLETIDVALEVAGRAIEYRKNKKKKIKLPMPSYLPQHAPLKPI